MVMQNVHKPNVPDYGVYVRIEGLRSILAASDRGEPAMFLRAGEKMEVRFTPEIHRLLDDGWAQLVDFLEEPSASQYFPTMRDVLEMIDKRATTLPGEEVLAASVDGTDLVFTVGRDLATSREVRVTLPALADMLDQVNAAEAAAARAEAAEENIRGLVEQAAQDAADAVTSEAVTYAAVAGAAAESALDYAEQAKHWHDSIGTIEGPVGPVGPAGPAGPSGPKGDVGPAGPVGPMGPIGPAGADGKSVTIAGHVDSAAALPTGLGAGDQGKGYITRDTGDMHVWSGTGWTNVGRIQGPKGERGESGPPGVPETEWQEVPLNARYTGRVRVRRVGNRVTVALENITHDVEDNGTSNYTLLNAVANLPSGFIPETTFTGMIEFRNSATEGGTVKFNTDGRVTVGRRVYSAWSAWVAGWPVNGQFDFITADPMPASATVPGTVEGPKGDKGDPGPAGPQGPKGDPGPKGDKGDTGPAGPQGDKGDTGPAGPQGVPGERGLPGLKGADGTNGKDGTDGKDGHGFTVAGTAANTSSLPPGAAVGAVYVLDDGTAVQWNGTAWSTPVPFRGPAGPQGPTGLRGATGATGPTGPQGPPGTDGKDYTPSGWSTASCYLRDNATINVGTGGSQTYKYRVDRGECTIYFKIKWGTAPTSGGGFLRITNLPVAPNRTVCEEYSASGLYWSQGGNMLFPLTINLPPQANELRFHSPVNGQETFTGLMRIWNGTTGGGTGVPLNPNFAIDAAGSTIAGSITYAV